MSLLRCVHNLSSSRNTGDKRRGRGFGEELFDVIAIGGEAGEKAERLR